MSLQAVDTQVAMPHQLLTVSYRLAQVFFAATKVVEGLCWSFSGLGRAVQPGLSFVVFVERHPRKPLHMCLSNLQSQPDLAALFSCSLHVDSSESSLVLSTSPWQL